MKPLKASETAYYVYQWLLSFDEEIVKVFPRQIAPSIGVCSETARVAFRKLEQLGYIKRVGVSMYQVFKHGYEK